MKLGKIALWIFVALLVSGILFGASVMFDINKIGGWDNVFNKETVIGFGEEYKVDEFKETDISDIRRIQFDLSSADTTLVLSQGNQVKASLRGVVKTTDQAAVPKLKVEAKGDTLYIVEVREANSVMSYSANLSMEVIIPDTFTGDLIYNNSSGGLTTQDLNLNVLSISTSSGDVRLGKVSVAEDFKVRSQSGRCEIDELSAETVTIESSSGDKQIKSISAKGQITFSAQSGITKIDRLAGSQVTIQTSSGDVNLGSVSADFTEVSGQSANIRINALEGGCEAKSSSGDVTVKCTDPSDRIDITSSSGIVEVSLPESTGFKLDVTTSSGRIDNQFRLTNGEDTEDHLSGSYKGGGMDVRVSTSSGNVSIKKH